MTTHQLLLQKAGQYQVNKLKEMKMAFYKKIDDDILKGENFVFSPVVTLKAEDKDSYEYPQDGWYWFDTFDEALQFFAGLKSSDSITMRQARLYLLSKGLLSQVDSIVSQNESWKIEWEYATDVVKNSPLVVALASQLGLSAEAIDIMFNEASKL